MPLPTPQRLLICIGKFTLALAALVVSAAPPAAAQQPLYLENFNQAAPQGFGDAHNTFARSMIWWQGKLFVGIQRDYACTQQAILTKYIPFKPYPPPDPTLHCATSPLDLSLRAEIWRWTPDSVASGPGVWDRVYQSPLIPIPGTTKTTGREMGFRDMTIFTEADLTETLYVSGTTSRGFIAGMPPPTILKSVNGGASFTPIPQAAGTTLGDLGIIEGINISSFNRMTTLNGKLYVVAGGDFGHGVIFESSTPSVGNNSFTRISPAGMTVTYLEAFKGSLYVAEGNNLTNGPPYAIRKMNTSTSPYTFTTVASGARAPNYLAAGASKSIATMHAAGDALWVGSNQPAELIRLNPNDTWDLFIGQPRQWTDGTWKYPRAGLGDGMDWPFNIHFHRMQQHDGFLYVASNDLSNSFPSRDVAGVTALFGERYGFDLNRTTNGWYFYPITFSGFANREPGPLDQNNWFNYTGRVQQSTPYGLFLGTGNDQFGLQIWRANSGGTLLAPPETLESEKAGANVILTWAPTAGAVTYHIFRADYAPGYQLGLPFYIAQGVYPDAYTEIGTSSTPTYTDTPPASFYQRHYYVVAEGAAGIRSNPSNVTRSPSLLPTVTFITLNATLIEWEAHTELSPALRAQITTQLQTAKLQALFNNYPAAATALANAYALGSTIQTTWRAEDFKVLLMKWARRVDLARQGKVSAWLL